jgi:hypothetical protein
MEATFNVRRANDKRTLDKDLVAHKYIDADFQDWRKKVSFHPDRLKGVGKHQDKTIPRSIRQD